MLILNSDRLYSELLGRSVQAVLSTAKVLIASSIAEASAALAQEPSDILVSSVIAADGEVLSALPDWVCQRKVVRNVLVVTPRKEPWVMQQLAESPVKGVVDANADLEEFDKALTVISSGREYWSGGIRAAIATALSSRSLISSLSSTERLVLSVIGTGCDDNVAAAQLGMSPGAVASVRKRLHKHLGVQHKGDLVGRALELGFVTINGGMFIQIGYASLRAAREKARRRDISRPLEASASVSPLAAA